MYDIPTLDRELFTPRQWKFIELGLSEGLNVFAYADPRFSAEQMEKILNGLEKYVDTGIYADPVYTPEQMEFIFYGLRKGFNVALYASPANSVDYMHKTYQKLLRIKNGIDPPNNTVRTDLFCLTAETARYMLREDYTVTPLQADGGIGAAISDPQAIGDTAQLYAVPLSDRKAWDAAQLYFEEQGRECRLRCSRENMFGIYQLRDSRYQGRALEELSEHDRANLKERYRLVYVDYLHPSDALVGLIRKYKTEPPPRWKSRTLEPGDIIVLHREGVDKAMYLNQMDTEELPGFFPEIKIAVCNSDRKAAYRVGTQYLSVQEWGNGLWNVLLYSKSLRCLASDIASHPVKTLEDAKQWALRQHKLSREPLKEINALAFECILNMAATEPSVTITSCPQEVEALHPGQKIPLSRADHLFEQLEQRLKIMGNPSAVAYNITYLLEGTEHHYAGSQILGEGSGGLIGHMKDVYTATLERDKWPEIFEPGDIAWELRRAHTMLDDTIPHFETHCVLSTLRKEHAKGMENCGKDGPVYIYHRSVLDYVRECRLELNAAQSPRIPPIPEPPHLERQGACPRETKRPRPHGQER
ncbi:LPD25 domain-containing protein [Pseudoflavonifractor phocaeensis]|uniref:LPD25 domain-containing protein n=1 Tax=Pseudoflavonifractor phocaeensis TaxID=1870988 RepID=UPI00210E3BAB|nr:YodL domain-containing protein [Pseudoflavonifractor phocaeensis]MCQ4866175.1 YodL domain-containing protein [Pseudoflavonifractor phocaeensis]